VASAFEGTHLMNAKKFDGCSCCVAPRKAFLGQSTEATSFSFERGFGADCTILITSIIRV